MQNHASHAYVGHRPQQLWLPEISCGRLMFIEWSATTHTHFSKLAKSLIQHLVVDPAGETRHMQVVSGVSTSTTTSTTGVPARENPCQLTIVTPLHKSTYRPLSSPPRPGLRLRPRCRSRSSRTGGGERSARPFQPSPVGAAGSEGAGQAA